MRLFLLPISTRRSLLYCQRLALQPSSSQKTTYADRITKKATTTWLEWEKKESGWQKKVTEYGNKLFQRLPYQEYGLKSIPPLSTKQREALKSRGSRRRDERTAIGAGRKGGDSGAVEKKETADGQGTARDAMVETGQEGDVSVEFPTGLIQEEQVWKEVRRLGSDEVQGFHTKWLLGSLLGMPISAPFALVPIVPNLPFFYLTFRAWSHWRARSGSRHLEFLLEEDMIRLKPSPQLRMAYTEASLDMTAKLIEADEKAMASSGTAKNGPTATGAEQEHMLLGKSSGKIIAEWLEAPALHAEIDRAVWQAERAIRASKELEEEKNELDSAAERNRR